ncbi:MAG: hypothetical protein NTX38_03950 [Methylobacter sp.]|nr:hypothetical protein [Methylobacter sp.]
MKKIKLKSTLLLGMLVITGSHVTTALAHTTTGESLLASKGTGATEIFRVDCSLDSGAASNSPTDKLYIAISDGNPAGGMFTATAAVYAPGLAKAITVIDTTGANGPGTGGTVSVITPGQQDVSFFVTVNHTAAANETFALDYHCQDAAGNHTGTAITKLQNN